MEDDLLRALDEYSLLPQRVNEPPIVALGCTAKELIVLVSVTFTLWLIALLPLLLTTTFAKPLFSALLIFECLTVYAACKLFHRLKRSRPRGYYVQFLKVYFEQYGLADSHLFTYTGPMDLGRNKQFISIPSLADVVDEYEELRKKNDAIDNKRARAQETL